MTLTVLALLFACRSDPPVTPTPTPPAPTDPTPTSSWPDTGITTLPTASSTGHTGHTGLLGTSTSDTSSTAVTGTTATTGGTASPTGHTGHTASTTASTGTTGLTASTGLTADTGQVTATTGDTTARSTAHTGTTHTGRSVTADTFDTAHTGDTSPTADTGAPVIDTVCEADLLPDDTASTGDTATSSVPTGDTGPEPIDTGPCGVVPPPPVDTAPPPVADTAEPECDPGCLAACPQVEWVFHLPGGTDVSLFDMESMPDGGFILAGDDERGVTFNEGLPDEIVVDETCPSVRNDAYLARIDGSGHTTWAHRVVDSCETAHMEEASVAADGVISLHGDYFAAVATIAPHSPSPFSLPLPIDNQDEWIAAYGPDGVFLQGHSVATDADEDSLMAVTTDDEGNLYAIGDFDQRVTFDAGTPQEHTLTHTGIAMFVISWDPTGAVRWSHIDALDAEYRTIEVYSAFVDDGELSVVASAKDTLWDACGPYESVAHETPATGDRWVLTRRASDGVYTGVSATTPHIHAQVHREGVTTTYGIPWFYENVDIGGTVVQGDEKYLAQQTSPTGPIHNVQTISLFTTRDLDARASTVAITGSMNSWTATVEVGCGADIEAPQPPDATGWYVFLDGSAVCGGTFGHKANYGTEGVAVDVDGSFYVGSTWFGDGIAAEGTPHELRLDPPDSDVVIVKYSW